MSTRAELDAALVKAEANWRKAKDELDQAQTALAKANANWDDLVVVQHKEEADRRKAGSGRRGAEAAWGAVVPDRRNENPDRRQERTDFVAFSKAVVVRHEAYVARFNAETARDDAAANLSTAVASREKAKAALDELSRP